MELKGFDPIFINWVIEILASGSSAILLNGVPGKPFVCRRGVRQGDALSPLLYVLGGIYYKVMSIMHTEKGD
jgi:hypothetical protein